MFAALVLLLRLCAALVYHWDCGPRWHVLCAVWCAPCPVAWVLWPVAWVLRPGSWVLGPGSCRLWPVSCGLWSVAYVLYLVSCGMWPGSCGLWPVACGMWPVACGLWPVACGLGPVACGLWPVACGLWPVACVLSSCCHFLCKLRSPGCLPCQLWLIWRLALSSPHLTVIPLQPSPYQLPLPELYSAPFSHCAVCLTLSPLCCRGRRRLPPSATALRRRTSAHSSCPCGTTANSHCWSFASSTPSACYPAISLPPATPTASSPYCRGAGCNYRAR